MTSPLKRTKHWLKRHFIPHEGNNHRPHLLHRHNIRDLIGVLLFYELILFVLPVLHYVHLADTLNLGAVLPGTLSVLTNEEREKLHMPMLIEDKLLTIAAELKAQDMATKSYFSHTSPEGRSPWYWFDKVGYQYIYAGENLAVNFIDSKEITQAWMNSPAHRDNIVADKFSEMGTGVATGMYKGREAIFVAQLYGTPLISWSNSGANVYLSSGWQTFTLNPERTIAAVLFVILLIILLALFLNIFVSFEHQHPDLITHALVVVSLVFGLQISNVYVVRAQMETSFTYTDIPSQVTQNFGV